MICPGGQAATTSAETSPGPSPRKARTSIPAPRPIVVSHVPSVTAVAVDGDRLLLVHRTDNDLWALPGGGHDLGETIQDTVVREVKEETGIDVQVTGLVGIYTDPAHVIAYDDGEVRQQFSICFPLAASSSAMPNRRRFAGCPSTSSLASTSTPRCGCGSTTDSTQNATSHISADAPEQPGLRELPIYVSVSEARSAQRALMAAAAARSWSSSAGSRSRLTISSTPFRPSRAGTPR